MVKLDVVQASTTTLVQSQPLVAVFFGGTSGIGHYTLRALAAAEASNGKSRGFRTYIVGRNASAAAAVTAECRSIYPAGKYVFVQASDLSLLKDVDRVCKEIIELEGTEGERAGMGPRIDYLMLSQGGAVFLPRIGKCLPRAVDGRGWRGGFLM
jgi:NAD(P)-dependent dehydrogenase (short-subunit alcohol dehydrogenase family)